ncbi:MarR family transcriptional regulator [Streptosporangium sp. NPDC050280]|uniref:MarR family winged helix-turn-helix transcriptional regulator n=1 Tax=unclassified Streptosporangium TaxID=2632669 RepID=UPI003417C5B9
MALVRGVVEHAGVLAAGKEIGLSVTGPSTAVCPVDEPTVNRAISNLVDNAIRYAPAGSRVEIDVEVGDTEATLIVTDHPRRRTGTRLPALLVAGATSPAPVSACRSPGRSPWPTAATSRWILPIRPAAAPSGSPCAILYEHCYISAVTSLDPTASPGRWDAVHAMLAALDAQIETVYVERGIEGVRPRFAYPLIRLAHTGPLTIRELADSLGRSHSAMSQTITAMRREGLVDSELGTDARTRRITLTGRGRALIPFLEAEWRATEAAVAELDDEIPHALSAVVAELERALARRPMRDRILAHLHEPPAAPAEPSP